MKEILDFIKICLEDNKILWTYHVNMRLKERHIPREVILSSTDSFEVIESNIDDKYLPSYLIYAKSEEFIFHVLIAIDKIGDNIRIVTAYKPDLKEWESNYKKRR